MAMLKIIVDFQLGLLAGKTVETGVLRRAIMD